MYLPPPHLSSGRGPDLAALHREDYLNEKKASSLKVTTLPTAPTVDSRLLRAELALCVGRFLPFA